jgi:hypothetical protein
MIAGKGITHPAEILAALRKYNSQQLPTCPPDQSTVSSAKGSADANNAVSTVTDVADVPLCTPAPRETLKQPPVVPRKSLQTIQILAPPVQISKPVAPPSTPTSKPAASPSFPASKPAAPLSFPASKSAASLSFPASKPTAALPSIHVSKPAASLGAPPDNVSETAPHSAHQTPLTLERVLAFLTTKIGNITDEPLNAPAEHLPAYIQDAVDFLQIPARQQPSPHQWPANLRVWVHSCLRLDLFPPSRVAARLVEKTIQNAVTSGSMRSRDWSSEPIPKRIKMLQVSSSRRTQPPPQPQQQHEQQPQPSSTPIPEPTAKASTSPSDLAAAVLALPSNQQLNSNAAASFLASAAIQPGHHSVLLPTPATLPCLHTEAPADKAPPADSGELPTSAVVPPADDAPAVAGGFQYAVVRRSTKEARKAQKKRQQQRGKEAVRELKRLMTGEQSLVDRTAETVKHAVHLHRPADRQMATKAITAADGLHRNLSSAIATRNPRSILSAVEAGLHCLKKVKTDDKQRKRQQQRAATKSRKAAQRSQTWLHKHLPQQRPKKLSYKYAALKRDVNAKRKDLAAQKKKAQTQNPAGTRSTEEQKQARQHRNHLAQEKLRQAQEKQRQARAQGVAQRRGMQQQQQHRQPPPPIPPPQRQQPPQPMPQHQHQRPQQSDIQRQGQGMEQ